MALMYDSRRIQSRICKRKRRTRAKLGDTSHRFPESFSGTVTQVVINPTVTTKERCHQGSSLETLDHNYTGGNPWIACTKTLDTQSKTSRCLAYSLLTFRHSEPLLAFRERCLKSVQGTIYHSSSRMSTEGQPGKLAFLRIAVSSLLC